MGNLFTYRRLIARFRIKAWKIRFYLIMKNSSGGCVIFTTSNLVSVGTVYSSTIPSGYYGGSVAIVNADKPGPISCQISLA